MNRLLSRVMFLLGVLPLVPLLAGCGESNTPVARQTASESSYVAVNADAPAEDESPVAVPTVAVDTGNAEQETTPIYDPAVQPVAYQAKAPSTTSKAARSTGKASGDKSPGYPASEERPKFDPIAVNGKFFEGWKKPKLAVVISGRQDGYLEPCGCAGLDQQKGGISRRQSLIADLEGRGWPVASVDVGGLVRRFGKQPEIQFGIAAESLRKMHYSAVGFGPSDLRLSAGEIVAAVAGADPKDSIFVSANVNLFDLTPKTRIVDAGGIKLGITSVLGDEYQKDVHNAEIVIQPAAESLKKVLPELQNCDVRILLAHATVDESRALAKAFPQFQIVVTSDGRDIPPQEPEKVPGTKTRLVEVAPKGMYVIVAGFYDDPKQPIRFQRVALDSRFPDSPEMKALMTTYQDQLRELGWQELGLKSLPHPNSKEGQKLAGQFASAASCKECHPTAYGIWSKTKHAHATETLAKLDPPRQFDPECISCHATGWNPQEFYPYLSGFESLTKTPQLAGNSCDNCHGPSAAHVAAEKGRSTSRKEAERQAIKLTAGFAKENVCVKCHDHDNSPEFNDATFDSKYWPKVEHKGKK